MKKRITLLSLSMILMFGMGYTKKKQDPDKWIKEYAAKVSEYSRLKRQTKDYEKIRAQFRELQEELDRLALEGEDYYSEMASGGREIRQFVKSLSRSVRELRRTKQYGGSYPNIPSISRQNFARKGEVSSVKYKQLKSLLEINKHKKVLLCFLVTRLDSGRKQLEALKLINEKNKDVEIIIVFGKNEKKEYIEKLVKDTGINCYVLLGNALIEKKFEVRSFPISFLYNQGKKADSYIGYLALQTFDSMKVKIK